jgi:type II secretory pathway component PulF
LAGLILMMAVWTVALISLARYVTMLFEAGSVNPVMNGLLVDRLAWWTPGFHGYLRDCGVAGLCEVVGHAVQAGRTMEDALTEAAAMQSNTVMRHRVEAWAEALREGRSIPEGARAARMPSILVAMLSATRDDRGMLQVLRFLAEHYESRVHRMREILISAYVPAVCCALGVAVGFVEYCLMYPMVELWRVLSC